MKYFSLIYQGEIHPATEKKIIPAEEFSLLIDGKEIIERAKQDAEAYKTETEKEAETLKEEAKEKGFAEGLEQFNEHLLSFDTQVRTMKHAFQQQILQLALAAAKKIVGEQLKIHPETIVDIVIQTLTPVTQNRRFVIYVNKADKELIEKEKPRIKEILEHVQILNVHERGDISPGGCIIETESGIINATIENQWRALESAFEKHMKSQK